MFAASSSLSCRSPWAGKCFQNWTYQIFTSVSWYPRPIFTSSFPPIISYHHQPTRGVFAAASSQRRLRSVGHRLTAVRPDVMPWERCRWLALATVLTVGSVSGAAQQLKKPSVGGLSGGPWKVWGWWRCQENPSGIPRNNIEKSAPNLTTKWSWVGSLDGSLFGGQIVLIWATMCLMNFDVCDYVIYVEYSWVVFAVLIYNPIPLISTASIWVHGCFLGIPQVHHGGMVMSYYLEGIPQYLTQARAFISWWRTALPEVERTRTRSMFLGHFCQGDGAKKEYVHCNQETKRKAISKNIQPHN